MSRTLTAEHKAKMREGRERWEAEEREAKDAREVAYREWVHEDAQLWSAMLSADLDDAGAYANARRAWAENLRRMPALP